MGSHLVQALRAKGADVLAVVRPGQEGGISNQLRMADLTKRGEVDSLFRDQKIDTVFHLAASAIVGSAAKNPFATMENNIFASLNILEAARQNKVGQVLMASTDKTYGDHAGDVYEGLPFKESYSLRGLDIYSSSKVCADLLGQAYAYQFKLPVALVRCCNIFGPGDLNFTRLIPKTIMNLLAGKPPLIKIGHEQVLREYMYVDDAVAAYLLIAERLSGYYGDGGKNMPPKGIPTYGWAAFNVGSYSGAQTKDIAGCEKIKSVTQVISLLRKKIRDISPEYIEQPPQFIEIPDEYMDSSKLLSLGFSPEVGFERGINNSIDWYKKHFDSLKKLAL